MPAPATSARPRPLRAPALRRLAWRLRRPAAALFAALALLFTVRELRAPGPATTSVLVAAHDLSAGAVLTWDDLAVAELPSAGLPTGTTGHADDLVSATTAVAVPAGLPLVPELLAPALSTAPPGDVVVPVRFADSALTGLLTPGIRLDVVAAEPGTAPRTVATGALVLASTTAGGEQEDDGGLFAGGGSAGSGTDSPVLLAVDPDQAVELSAASASTGLTAILLE